MTTETAALASHEPDLFAAFAGYSWPSTFLPAFELVAAARRAQGVRVAEEVDYALRLAFFRHGVGVSILAGLQRALELAHDLRPDVDVQRVQDAWRTATTRADVAEDYRISRTLPIQGSPQIFWPDGSTTHNPGMTDPHRANGQERFPAPAGVRDDDHKAVSPAGR